MQGIHYCIITKTQIHYSHPTAFPSPSTVHLTLVYLGNKFFWDMTTKAIKSPPPPHIQFNEPLPGNMTSRAAHLKNRNEQKEKNSDSESTQESESKKDSGSNTESGSSEYDQEFQEQESHKRKCKVTVIKTKEYKIPRHKKLTASKKCVLCFQKFPSQKELNDHTSIDHNEYKYMCKYHKCGKTFVSDSGLKRHNCQH